ncbi:cytochrome c [Sulfurimonas sp.]|uniref:c-type cytochrome n=1 Tax=Sulfurimonas sp. TaxID=2022749 RepID=UPI002AB1DE70|nr:cytochrome c [Sulfurimonas sp.]
MKNYKTVVLILSLFIFGGCSEEKKEQTLTKPTPKVQKIKVIEVKKIKENAIKKEYTIEEIYNTKCIECHASNGSGNTEKLTPTMIGQSEEEIRDSLTDIEDDKGHIVMEHNREKIVDAGMQYSAKDMAKYMYERFNK